MVVDTSSEEKKGGVVKGPTKLRQNIFLFSLDLDYFTIRPQRYSDILWDDILGTQKVIYWSSFLFSTSLLDI